MKLTIALVMAVVLATTAHATNRGGGDASAAAIAAQAQLQGQHQYQSSKNVNNNNVNARANANSGANAAIGDFSHSAETTITTEGSVALAALGSSGCAGFGITAGAPGAGAFGLNISSGHCKDLAMAAAAELYGGNGAAYLCVSDRTFRNTQPQLCTSRTAITNQTYDGGKGESVAVSTRSAPQMWSNCERIDGVTYITPYEGYEPSLVQAQCMSYLNNQ